MCCVSLKHLVTSHKTRQLSCLGNSKSESGPSQAIAGFVRREENSIRPLAQPPFLHRPLN